MSAALCLQPARLDRFIGFDREAGHPSAARPACCSPKCCASRFPPAGFLPVVPGTQFVTVGGAIANDVHGKNHHAPARSADTCGDSSCCARTATRLVCSPSENAGLVRRNCRRAGTDRGDHFGGDAVASGGRAAAGCRNDPLRQPREFFALSAESERDFEYTVAWIDCLARGRQLGRGLFQRANHSCAPGGAARTATALAMPFVPPVSLINSVVAAHFQHLSLQAAAGQPHAARASTTRRFFFPLDGIRNWNRLYGPRGFYQYQCVIPARNARDAIAALLARIAHSGTRLIPRRPQALRRGRIARACCRFRVRASPWRWIFRTSRHAWSGFSSSSTGSVNGAQGRLYPAKDGRMPSELFRSGYPRWREFSEFVDPRFSSRLLATRYADA